MQKVRRNDTVRVTVGRGRGKQGTVRQVLPTEGRVVVQGVNMVKRHTRSRGPTQPGGIVEKEASLHISNVMVVCKSCGKAVRVGFRVRDDGQKTRVCRSCSEDIV